MSTRYRVAIFGFVASLAVLLAMWLAAGNSYPVLDPKGVIASQQRDLIVWTTLLMLLVVVPVFALTIYIAWKYRASNTMARYTPDWDRNRKLEAIWWGFPTIVIAVLSVIIWQSSHSLDPYRPLASGTPPVTVQVVALQWKWLFLYPEQNIATVNYLQLPVGTPVNFVITADAPMNSFWIPNLGGQVYAMAGMTTKLHLMADEAGTYNGSSANLSGAGFAGMKFTAAVVPPADFQTWVQSVKRSSDHLSRPIYDQLALPSTENILASYASMEKDLHAAIIMKYAGHGGSSRGQEHGSRRGSDHQSQQNHKGDGSEHNQDHDNTVKGNYR